VEFGISDDSLRFGLAAIKNISQGVARAIIKCRKCGEFKNIQDFIDRVSAVGTPVNRRQFQSLVLAGACDSLYQSRHALMQGIENTYQFKDAFSKYERAMDRYLERQDQCEQRLAEIEAWSALTKEEKREKKKPGKLKDPVKPEAPRSADLSDQKEFSKAEILKNERELLGFYISGHPINLLDDRWKYGVSISQIKERVENKQQVTLVAMIQSATIKTSKSSQKKYANLVLEDKTATIEAVLFPQVFAKQGELVDDLSRPFLLHCKTDITETDESRIVRLHVHKLQKLNYVQTTEEEQAKTIEVSSSLSTIDQTIHNLAEANSDTLLLSDIKVFLGSPNNKGWKERLNTIKTKVGLS